MKEQLLGIKIRFYLKNIDKLFKLQHHFLVGFTVISWIPLYQLYIYVTDTCECPYGQSEAIMALTCCVNTTKVYMIVLMTVQVL